MIVIVNAPRDLVKEGFPLHDAHVPALLENIGDHERDIIETVLFAVANARYAVLEYSKKAVIEVPPQNRMQSVGCLRKIFPADVIGFTSLH